MKQIIAYSIFLFCIFCTTFNQAQDKLTVLRELGIEDGLSSYNISTTIQDSRGFIWLGTDYGVNRFDGNSFKVYTQEENGLCSNQIQWLAEDWNGNIWIAAKVGGKLCFKVLNYKENKLYDLKTYLGPNFIDDLSELALIPPHNDELYFFHPPNSTETYRFYAFKKGEKRPIFKNLNLLKKHPNYRCQSFLRMSDGRYAMILVGNSLNHKNFVLVLDEAGKELERLLCPEAFDHANFREGGEARFCLYCETTIQKDNTISGQYFVNGQVSMASLNLQVNPLERHGYRDGQLFVLGPDSLKVYNKDGSLLHRAFFGHPLIDGHNNIFVDKDHNIWTTDNQKLYQISLVEDYFRKEFTGGDYPFKIRGISTDAAGAVYAGGVGFFLRKSSDGSQEKLDMSCENIQCNVLGMMAEDSGIWVGTEGQTLHFFDYQTQATQVYTQGNPVIGPIWAMHRAPDRTLWIGGTRGLALLNEGKKQVDFVQLQGDSLLRNSTIYHFLSKGKGTWLSTSSGLYLVDLSNRKVLAHYSAKSKGAYYLPATHIAHIHIDKEGVFWLASKGSGLIRWNPANNSHQQYTQQGAGLSHNVLYAVYEDDYDNLWIPSQRGLMRFSKASKQVRIFLEANGLGHNEFNTISHYKSKDGRLYFGGQNGLIHFHPKDFQKTDVPAPLLITGYYTADYDDKVENKTAAILTQPLIKLKPGDKSFTLTFALLDYSNAQDHQYAYQIEGYDKSWQYLPKATLKISGLPYGRYKLKLRAKSAQNGQWMDYAEPIIVQVLRPFYLQGWFIVLMMSLTVGLGYFFVNQRISVLKKRKEELEIMVVDRTAIIEADKQKIAADKEVIELQAEELRSLDKLKSRFFANISHELRTPLTLILGPLSYILDRPEEWEKDEIRQQLLTMQRNGKSLMFLIEEILDLSKMEVGKLELQEESTPVQMFFEQLFAVFQPQFQGKGQLVSISFQLTTNVYLMLDRKKIEKVFNNLLSNAIKFTAAGERIDVEISNIADKLMIKVSDSGKGIHPNDLPHVFERFYQSKQEEQQLMGGTGIGLALVYEFAVLMKGKVSVESELNKGTSFFFEIPAKYAKPIALPSIAEELIAEENNIIEQIGGDFNILLVEDNSDMRDFVQKVLSNRYKKVFTANNGLEGLKVLAAEADSIDLIVSDVMMPEMDGLEMLKQIKSHPDWYKIPVIMLTALAAERDKLSALTIGVDDYLTKPFSVSELLVRAQNLLYNYQQRQQWASEEADSLLDDLETKTISNQEDQLDETKKDWIIELSEFIRDSFDKGGLDVDELANFVHLSKRQLTRKLKEATGLTPAKFIREVQLKTAIKALEDGTAISVTELGISCGFENLATFSTVFKQRFGKSPSAYL